MPMSEINKFIYGSTTTFVKCEMSKTCLVWICNTWWHRFQGTVDGGRTYSVISSMFRKDIIIFPPPLPHPLLIMLWSRKYKDRKLHTSAIVSAMGLTIHLYQQHNIYNAWIQEYTRYYPHILSTQLRIWSCNERRQMGIQMPSLTKLWRIAFKSN